MKVSRAFSAQHDRGNTESAKQWPPRREPVEDAGTAPKRQTTSHRRRIGLFLVVVDVMLSRRLTHSSPFGGVKLCDNSLNLLA